MGIKLVLDLAWNSICINVYSKTLKHFCVHKGNREAQLLPHKTTKYRKTMNTCNIVCLYLTFLFYCIYLFFASAFHVGLNSFIFSFSVYFLSMIHLYGFFSVIASTVWSKRWKNIYLYLYYLQNNPSKRRLDAQLCRFQLPCGQ